MMKRTLTLTGLAMTVVMAVTAFPAAVRGAIVSGRVVMPDVCAPEVSPAVVVLEPVQDGGSPSVPTVTDPAVADVILVNQRGLQFVPRVQAIRLGQAIRFTNDDSETHNVHVVSSGNDFNQSMTPGQPRDFTPDTPGVVRLACDIHSHMRGYVVVSRSPWVRVCSAQGRFRLDEVPDGRYTLTVWHEMGDPLRNSVEVHTGHDVNLGTLTLSGPAPVKVVAGPTEPSRPWSEVIDRIGVRLASAVDAAAKARGQADGFRKARKQAEDAYWVDFESSDMETAVRLHLGVGRAGEIERRFRAVVPALREVAEGRRSAGTAVEATRPLILGLSRAAGDLDKKGVTDGAHLHPAGVRGSTLTETVAPASPSDLDPKAQLAVLRGGFDRILALADQGEADEAEAAMTEVYWGEFEPLERFVAARKPDEVRPLEARFNTIRGNVGTGLKGRGLADRLNSLHAEVAATLERSRAQASGAFGAAFVTSLITAVREGVEVILLLAMLVALAAKTGQAGAMRAIGLGVVLAMVASAATALALNLMVAATQGRTREVMEGSVMLLAAGVLFYVSYWLISQSESKRWMDYLKRQVARGALHSDGGRGGLALSATAFLAVYREGAETALMYQALIGSQGGARAGLTGLAAGLGVAVVILAGFAYVIRATSVRLPLRTFFQVTGGVLFAMAVVFAGNGVYELQSSGLIKLTPLGWLGGGLPVFGVHPNLQALSVQGLLVSGAGLAMVILLTDHGNDAVDSQAARIAKPTAGVGA